MAAHWTTYEDDILKKIYPHNKKADILSHIPKDWKSICRRARRLGLTRDPEVINEDRITRGPRKDAWTPEEEELLKKIYPSESKENILAAFNRPWKGIWSRAYSMGLRRDKDVILHEMQEGGRAVIAPDTWTPEENEILQKIYESRNKEDIMASLPNRTWRAIRNQAIKLGMRRNEKIICEERNEANKKTLRERYGVDYPMQLDSIKKKFRETNLKRRSVEYPSQSEEIREKSRQTVQEQYGVDNVFQSEDIKAKIRETMIKKYGGSNPMQVPEIMEKARITCEERYGVKNPFQIADRVREGMHKKYGYACPMQVPEIIQRTNETNLKKYGFARPAQNPEIREKIRKTHLSGSTKTKKYIGMKKKGYFQTSKGEDLFLDFLREIDPSTTNHKLHPILKHVIDYYMPEYDLWVQYDGSYWHGKIERSKSGPQYENIKKIIERDNFQNESIPNLIRFDERSVQDAIKEGTIFKHIQEKIDSKNELLDSTGYRRCHQYLKKIEWFEEDIDNLSFDISSLKASDFDLNQEPYTPEIRKFIEKYEWLGSVGRSPSYCFTARYREHLAGVVLITEPIGRSNLLGKDTKKYEALINRGATSSWAPKNLGSRLIMFSCRWMTHNTEKRLFTAYADPRAGEQGIIYQSCNFDYLGNTFGASAVYRHPSIPKKFTPLYLRQTSTFKRWCRENGIILQKSWFKENGTKDLSQIPEDIKNTWYEWGRNILRESEKTEIERKGKYALLIGKDKRELNYLRTVKQYRSFPYPHKKIRTPKITKEAGKTRSRKNPLKIQYIIDNYGKMSRQELCSNLNESLRWVKRQISTLKKEGKISTPGRPSIL